MSTKRAGILGVLAVVAVAVQISSSALPQRNGDSHSKRRFHDINRLVRQREDGTSTSTNWSGYAVTGSGFTKAVGSWIVPAGTCTGSGTQYASFWVGIDGYNSNTVEQLGTETDCVGHTATYHAWYEFCCIEPEITIPSLPVAPGDVIEAAVTYTGTGFTLAIKDVTTGKSYSKSGNISGARRTSAEWVAEAPSSGGVLPLANFGTSVFGKDSTGIASSNTASIGTKTGAIGKFPNFFQITMVNNSNNPKAVPSILSSDLTSFSDTWVASQ